MENLKTNNAGSSLAAPLRGTALELAAAELERLPKMGGWLRFETGWLDAEQALRNRRYFEVAAGIGVRQGQYGSSVNVIVPLTHNCQPKDFRVEA